MHRGIFQNDTVVHVTNELARVSSLRTLIPKKMKYLYSQKWRYYKIIQVRNVAIFFGDTLLVILAKKFAKF
jgi:hypothetical protein